MTHLQHSITNLEHFTLPLENLQDSNADSETSDQEFVDPPGSAGVRDKIQVPR